jgi:hypothetical protein
MLLYYINLNTPMCPNNNVVAGTENIFQKWLKWVSIIYIKFVIYDSYDWNIMWRG